ncbi:EAL and HDOD domain-containing protein [Halonatronum saccharophilum]|uniref:EAL and HDOD domain-containing protein n=1 Tax=Halonatronum saccharophilum TaxID=150060 RepID=UPI0006881B79|nr:HDOD domain-containing protein [Halonatronum saccharophilum]
MEVRQVEVFVARQPIFDRDKNIYGYELLYRNGFDNFYKSIDGDKATSEVINNSFLLIGIENLTEGKKAFINFTTKLLKEEVPNIFNKQILVIEILEGVQPDRELINACKRMKEKGYSIALDDFIFEPKFLPLLELADIIKVDFIQSDKNERRRLAQIGKRKGITLLAEKVETREEFEEALDMGYSLFQGYFFSKPVILSGNDLPTIPNNYFRIIKEVNKEEPDIAKISSIIERDLSLSYKLLRLINSASFYLREEVNSINNALALLGLEEFEKWISLIVIKDISKEGTITENIKTSLIRAKLSESIAEEMGIEENKSEFFLMGIFSMLDVLMNRKLVDILNDLPISNKIKWALLGAQGELRDVYELTLSYERANWDRLLELIDKFKLKEYIIGELYIEAIEWANQILELE